MILGRLSIRARITIGSFLLALIFFSGTAYFVHGQVASILDRTTLELLESDSAPYVGAGAALPDAGPEQPGEDQLIAVLDQAGAVRLTTLPKAMNGSIKDFLKGAEGARTLTVSGRTYWALVTRVHTADGPWTIVATRSDASNQVVLNRLTVGLAWGLAGLSALFALVSWLLTGAALRPVAELRRSADSLIQTGSPGLLEVGGARDEVTQLARTLNRLISGLHDSAEREKQLVSDASHELRTPLALLQARLELLRRAVPVEQEGEVRAAEAAVHRLTALVSDLLELSRIEASGSSGHATFGELAEALVDSVDRGRLSAASTQITIDYEVGDAAGGAAQLSSATFGRIVDNLIKNAVTALGESGRVWLALSLEPETGMRLTVVDDGPGISEDFLPRAFDRFSREDLARTAHHGTGLGLSIVEAATSAANGTVELHNTGHGLRVSVLLPLAAPAQ